MPYPVPHTFPTLRGNGVPQRRSLLMMGAGLSVDCAPLPPVLFATMGIKASETVGCTPPVAGETLYTWAERAITHLISVNDPNPKLSLGESLGLTSDTCWLGYGASVRSKPRHRVIARFGREGLWDQIWSFNWDCVQESAMENVGIPRDGVDPLLPWPTGFRTFVTAAESQHVADQYMVHMIKPHGCVRALVDAKQRSEAGDSQRALDLAARFLITQAELDALASNTPAQVFIFATLCSRMSGHPLVTVGWRASEPYLLTHIETAVRPLLQAANVLADDELSIVDIAFQDGHRRLAQCYNKTQDQAYVPIATVGFTTDVLFLWIQALYGLDRLRMVLNAQTRAADVLEVRAIEGQLMSPPEGQHFAIDWIDNFLPVWVRLCWRCGLMECQDRQHNVVPAEQFNLERRDEHIPWNLNTGTRYDLLAAGMFLAAIQRNGSAATWNCADFPGGIYRSTDSHLVIPLPAWRVGSDNELRGLQPLLNALQISGMLPVQKISVLPLMTGNAAAGLDVIAVLKESLARRIGMAAFAGSDRIGVIDLAAL